MATDARESPLLDAAEISSIADESLSTMSFDELDALHVRLSNDLDERKEAIRRVRRHKDAIAAESSVRAKLDAMSPAEREAVARMAREEAGAGRAR
jgi:hypothetical protein